MQEGLFGGVEAGGDLAEAGGSYADVGDELRHDGVVEAGEAGEGYLGDGLGVASAYLADVGFVIAEVT